MESKEVLLTSSRHTQQWSACLWDHTTGNVLHFYRNGGTITPKTLNLIGSDYLITSDEDKPIIHIWPLNSQEPTKKLTTILSDKAAVLTVCPRSAYIAAGIGAKLFIWHISSGKLFSVQKRNFQPITCIKFSNDSTYVIVAGQDGMLIVYRLASLISLHSNYSELGQAVPVYSKNDHSMPITDVHVGGFAEKSRLVTVSTDQTCKLYALHSGQLLLSLVFNEPLTSVVFDKPCWSLYVGGLSGRIRRFLLKNPPRTLEHHVSDDLIFVGHEKRVTCLDLNISNTCLVSGSDDNFVFVWEINSRQILKRLEHKSEITNVKFLMKHENFFVQNLKPRLFVRNFDRELNQSDVFVESKMQDYDLEVSSDEEGGFGDDSGLHELQKENLQLRTVNRQLYDAALEISRKVNKF